MIRGVLGRCGCHSACFTEPSAKWGTLRAEMRVTWPRSVVALAVGGILIAVVLFDVPATSTPRPYPKEQPSLTAITGRSAEGAGASLHDRRPNVLVIEADDMRADDLRFMPRLHQMVASTGISFANSFAPNPLCCPSRASFLTGQYSHNHGVLSHEQPYGFSAFDDTDTLATRLQGAGYSTALVGKYLNGYGEDPIALSAGPSLRYVPPGWTEWYGSTDHLWPERSVTKGGTYNYFHLTSNVNGTIASWPNQYTTNVTARQTRRLIGQFSRSSSKPWFIWWTPVAPHSGNPVESDDDVSVPTASGQRLKWRTPARPRSVKGRFDRLITHGSGVPLTHAAEPKKADKPRYLTDLPPLTPREVLAARDMTRQRAEALWVLDRQVGRTLRALRRKALHANTIVVFTSDNGFYLGEHDKRWGKATLHEPSIRVPLLMTGPGIPRGRRFDPVTTIDLAPTIASWAGTKLKAPDGIDLSQIIQLGDHGWRRAVVLEGSMSERPYDPQRAAAGRHMRFSVVGIRTGRWKVVNYNSGESEWYDLATDPLELSSLRVSQVPKSARQALLDALGYVTCRGAECRQPLPARLSMGPRAERLLTKNQRQAEVDYYESNE